MNIAVVLFFLNINDVSQSIADRDVRPEDANIVRFSLKVWAFIVAGVSSWDWRALISSQSSWTQNCQ